MPVVVSGMRDLTPRYDRSRGVAYSRCRLAGWSRGGRRRRCRGKLRGLLLALLVPQVTYRAAVGRDAQVGCQLQTQHFAVHVQNDRVQPPDGDDPISLFELAEHHSTLALLVLLGSEEQHVDDRIQRHHEDDRTDRKPLRSLQNNHRTPPRHTPSYGAPKICFSILQQHPPPCHCDYQGVTYAPRTSLRHASNRWPAMAVRVSSMSWARNDRL